MTYIKFKGRGAERNLIKAILSSSQASILGKNFPRVTVIGRTKIYPDIDILRIENKKSGAKRLIGFEVKVVKLIEEKKQKKGWKLGEIYKGVGQALLYLQFGVDRCGLILGFHENVSDDKINEFYKKLENKSSLLTKILGRFFSLRIFRWEKGGIVKIVEAKEDFLYSGYEDKIYGKEIYKKIKNFRNNLLNKEIQWDKKLAQSCEYAEKK